MSKCLLRLGVLRVFVLFCVFVFGTGHFVIVPFNLTCLHCLHYFFEHHCNLYEYEHLCFSWDGLVRHHVSDADTEPHALPDDVNNGLIALPTGGRALDDVNNGLIALSTGGRALDDVNNGLIALPTGGRALETVEC